MRTLDRAGRRRPVLRPVVGLTFAGLLVAMTATAAAAARLSPGPPTAVTITPPHPSRVCSGDTATVSWTPPVGHGAKRITGYEVQVDDEWNDPPIGPVYDVGPTVMSQTIPLVLGDVDVLVWPVTAAGRGDAPGTASIFVESAPMPVEFWGGGVTGDHTVTLDMGWSGEEGPKGPGGSFADTRITLTRSDGKLFHYTPTDDTQPIVLAHENDGQEYSWSSSARNRCGTTAGSDTPGFQTGVAPSFDRVTPPLAATVGARYHYWFHASGVALPTYSLDGAPSWLTIDPATGAVTGVPPAGTTEFSYAVEASNHVGEDLGSGPRSAAISDTFSVTVNGDRPSAM